MTLPVAKRPDGFIALRTPVIIPVLVESGFNKYSPATSTIAMVLEIAILLIGAFYIRGYFSGDYTEVGQFSGGSNKLILRFVD